jgi:hypothetical protein
MVFAVFLDWMLTRVMAGKLPNQTAKARDDEPDIRGRRYRIARWWCEGGVAMQVSLKNVHPESQVRSA